MISPNTLYKQHHNNDSLFFSLPGESALHLAIVNGDLPAVKYLVSKGAKVNHPTTQVFYNDDNKTKITQDETENEYKREYRTALKILDDFRDSYLKTYLWKHRMLLWRRFTIPEIALDFVI